MFKKILLFFLGYFNIEVEGYYIEKFINICTKKGITLWGIDRSKSVLLKTKILVSDYEQAKEIAKQNQCIITVKKENGFPKIVKKYKNRKVFIFSFLFVLIVSFTLSKFIWNIQVEGIDKISENEIIDEAKKYGLKTGVLKTKIDTDRIVNKIRIDREDVAWIGIKIKGTNAIIEVVEADAKPEIVDENDFNNIIADKGGEIVKIYAQNGTAMVKEGDKVKAGDVLIAGWMEGDYTGKQYVNGNGVIKAKIKYSDNKKIDKKEIIREKTGKKDKKIAIKINNFKINLYKRLSKFKKYDTIYTEKKLRLFSNFYLPINFIFYTNYEVNEIENTYDYEQAKAYGEQQIRSKIEDTINGEIISSTTDITEYDSYYNVMTTYEVIEEIGTKEKIVF